MNVNSFTPCLWYDRRTLTYSLGTKHIIGNYLIQKIDMNFWTNLNYYQLPICRYPSTRTWLKGNQSCHTPTQSCVNICPLINNILGHLYAYYLIPYRSPMRQTG